MVKIEAVIQPFRLDEVKAALRSLSCGQFIISEVGVSGGSHAPVTQYRGCRYEVDVRRVKIELTTHAHCADEIVEALCRAACTHLDGDDGIVIVSDVLNLMRIHRGATGLRIPARNKGAVVVVEEPVPVSR